MAGEHPAPGHVHLQQLPHPLPGDPHSCTLLTEVSQGGQLAPGPWLSDLGGALANLGVWEHEPGWVALCSACVSPMTYGLTAGDLLLTHGSTDSRTPKCTL